MKSLKHKIIKALPSCSSALVFLCFFALVFLCFNVLVAQAGVAEKINNSTRSLFGHADYMTSETIGDPLALRVGVIVNTVLMLVGIMFLIFTVYSGIQWMLSGGNEETTTKSRIRIKRAVIGFAIVLGAWIIVNFVLRAAFGPSQSSGIYRVGDENAGIEVRIQR